jgi:hypothetical protein
MPPPRYTVRPHARVLRLWQSTLLQWEQAGLYGRILRTGTNQHNLRMPQPRHPPLWPTIYLLPDFPDVAATREQSHYGGAHPGLPDPSLRVPPVNTYIPSLHTGSHAQQGGAPLDGPYPPYFAYGSCARNDKDNTRYGGARANHT